MHKIAIKNNSYSNLLPRMINNLLCNTQQLAYRNGLSLKQGMGNRGIRESGNPGIGESGNRGVAESGNPGIGES